MKWRPGLNARLAMMSATAVAIAIAAVSVLAWWSTSQTMRSEIDRTLAHAPMSNRAGALAGPAGRFDIEQLCRTITGLSSALQPEARSLQLVRADGTVCGSTEKPLVPVTAVDIAAASGGPQTGVRDATTTTGLHVRVITYPVANGYALMTWRDLTELRSE